MKVCRLDAMVRGWFVGAFARTAFATEACEVAVKQYRKGDHEEAHYHRVATEVTLVLEGRVRMLGREFERGDIVVLTPGEATDFTALETTTCVVVKVPGALEDKFLVEAAQ